MFTINVTGSFKNMDQFLNKMTNKDQYARLEAFGRAGVDALSSATPKDSGATAKAWRYKIDRGGGQLTISWYNTNVHRGFPVAIALQYGHGTGTGGYVVGRDYINPAIRPIFDKILDDVWKVVRNA